MLFAWNIRYSKSGYSVWCYKEREIPNIINNDIQELLWDKLLAAPDVKIASEFNKDMAMIHHYKLMTSFSRYA